MTTQTHSNQSTEQSQPTISTKEDVIVAPQTANDHILNLQRTIGNQSTMQMMGKPSRVPFANINMRMATTRKIQRLTSPSEQRKQQFETLASSHQMTAEQIDTLWQLSTQGTGDPILKNFEDSDDYDMTVSDAKKHASNTQDSVFEAKVSIKNLAGLNTVFGHSEADHHLKQIVETVRQSIISRLKKVKAPEPISFRLKGKELHMFIVVPADKKFSKVTIQKIIKDSGVEIENYMKHLKDAKNNKIANPKKPKQLGVHLSEPEVTLVESDNNIEDATDDTATESHGRGKDFKDEAHTRKEKFIENAQKYNTNLSDNEAEALYNVTGSNRGDKLTGFGKGHDRKPTMERAIQYVSANHNFGVKGVYVEVDIRNLGGLIEATDESTALKHFSKMSAIAEDTLMSQLGSDISAFRHGGDEFSFIVVGTDADLSGVKGAMVQASNKIKSYVEENNLHKIPHPKHPKNAKKIGTGIVFGLAEITRQANQKAEAIFSTADQQVEAKKSK